MCLKNPKIFYFSGNIPVDEQSDEVKLSEMPMEILQEILVHLDHKHLLTASHVCKSFAAAAETPFAQKYSKERNCIVIYGMSDEEKESVRSFHEIMLNKYGDKMRNMSIGGADERLLDLVEQKCCNLKELELSNVAKIIMANDLKTIRLCEIHNLNRETFGAFIDHNQRLEFLEIINNDVDLLDLLDGRLNSLKTLEYHQILSPFPAHLPKISLNALETLTLVLDDAEIIHRALRAMDCNRIKSLKLNRYIDAYVHADELGTFVSVDIDADENVVNAICEFATLVSLHLPAWLLTNGQLGKLARRLGGLSELSIKMAGNPSEIETSIRSVLSHIPKLTKVTISLNSNDFERFSNDVKQNIYDFHARFAIFNTQIDVTRDTSTVSTSKDRIYVCDKRSVELHWMDNFNEKNIRNVINGIDQQNELAQVKFVNKKCVEHSLDISTLLGTHFNDTASLHIDSIGPIAVNGNVNKIVNFYHCIQFISFTF